MYQSKANKSLIAFLKRLDEDMGFCEEASEKDVKAWFVGFHDAIRAVRDCLEASA